MLRLAQERNKLTVINDQHGAPTGTDLIADVTAHAKAIKSDLPLKVADVAAVPTSAFPTPATRPLNSRLCTAKLQHAFGLVLPPWQQGVDRMLAEIF